MLREHWIQLVTTLKTFTTSTPTVSLWRVSFSHFITCFYFIIYFFIFYIILFIYFSSFAQLCCFSFVSSHLNYNVTLIKEKDCWVGKGKYMRRIKIHGRGRSGVMHHPHHHLYVVLREVPLNPAETRLGRFGRSNKTLRRQMGLEDESTPVVVESSSSPKVASGEKQMISNQ